jgi:hypothetical protein
MSLQFYQLFTLCTYFPRFFTTCSVSRLVCFQYDVWLIYDSDTEYHCYRIMVSVWLSSLATEIRHPQWVEILGLPYLAPCGVFVFSVCIIRHQVLHWRHVSCTYLFWCFLINTHCYGSKWSRLHMLSLVESSNSSIESCFFRQMRLLFMESYIKI